MTEIEFIDSLVKDKNTNCLGAVIMEDRIGFIINKILTPYTIQKFNDFNKYWTVQSYGPDRLEISLHRKNK